MFTMHPFTAATLAAVWFLSLSGAGLASEAVVETAAVEPTDAVQDVLLDPTSTGTVLELAAVEDAANTEIETIVVSGQRRALSAELPGASAGVTGTELRERVFVNTEDALRHLPDLTIRKRYVGDRNALIGGRSHGTLQPPRGLVYADGVLLSNFLGRFNAPRWNMVAPEEISRTDVLYGPYSALYPGNSIGTTVLLTTRDPEQLTASARAQFFSQTYQGYGDEDDYGGRQYSAFSGNRWGPWSGTLGINRLQNKSQPMQYATATRVDAPTQAQQATAVNVTGAIADLDPRNQPRLILGPDGGSLEDGAQDQVKGKLAYESQGLRVDGQLGYWVNDFDREGRSFLRDPSGATFTRGNIRVNNVVYTVPATAFGPQAGREEHLLSAVTARTRRDLGWNASAVVSAYEIGEDVVRSSVATDANARAGTIADGGSGKGWWNADLQTSYRADDRPHAITLGYYHSRYALDSKTYATTDWRRGTRGALTAASHGVTVQQALYAQDAWAFAPGWTATAGLRFERWKAYDGRRQRTVGSAIVTAPYADRDETALSPKLSLAYAPGAYVMRYSVGRGVRFATVSELFQGAQNGTSITNNNPNLRSEDSLSHDLTLETTLAVRHRLRVSLFHDDVEDSIAQQLNQPLMVTNINNVDRVSSTGLELVYQVKELLPNVVIDANLSLVNSKIKENAALPVSEGKHWLRIPRSRANLVANWHFQPAWNLNLAARHSGRQFNELDNSDTNSQVFGGTSRFTTLDTRLGYTWREKLELGLGVENLTNEAFYAFHPFPQRTLIAELRASF